MMSAERRVISEFPEYDSEEVIVVLHVSERRQTGVEAWHPFPNLMRLC